jgi:hypothetical protein
MIPLMPGDRFGHVTLIKRRAIKEPRFRCYWYCKCDCGRVFFPLQENLVSGKTKSCVHCHSGRKKKECKAHI